MPFVDAESDGSLFSRDWGAGAGGVRRRVGAEQRGVGVPADAGRPAGGGDSRPTC